jgi:hypothetical protein
MSGNTEFQLSRIQAEGWKAAQDYAKRGRPGDAKIIAALNPHQSEAERARWYVGFNSAIEKL